MDQSFSSAIKPIPRDHRRVSPFAHIKHRMRDEKHRLHHAGVNALPVPAARGDLGQNACEMHKRWPEFFLWAQEATRLQAASTRNLAN
jgi:hypothetical protein